MTTRVGFGYDSHTFGADRPLRLAGVVIDPASGLTGHSDGDAVAHAVIDALLGASALGDIGRLFPDTDPEWKDADSMALLHAVRTRLADRGFSPVNVDVTVVTEAPRLAPHIEGMRQRLAETLGIEVGAVSVKGKTNEGMDAVGAGRGLVVYAVAAVDGS